MPVATATKQRGAKSRTQIATPDELRAIVDHVTSKVLIERQKEMHVVLLGALAGVNIHFLGPPGTAKSLGLRTFSAGIDGAIYFEKQVHAQMPADALIGPYDMPKFAKTGVFERAGAGYLPHAHVANIDEVTRANGPTIDSTLSIANTEERMAEHNGGMVKTPLLFLVTSSNYMPAPDDPQLGAWVDRITLMHYVDYVQSGDSFKEMFRRHHARMNGQQTAANPPTVTLEAFQGAQEAVKAIEPTDEYLDAYEQVRQGVRNEGLPVSDRRFMELGRVSRARAYMSGRDRLVPSDLAAIEAGLWRERTDIPVAHGLIMPFLSHFEQEANERRAEAAPHLSTLAQLRPQVEGTPVGEELADDVLQGVLKVKRPLAAVHKRVRQSIDEARKEGEDAPDLHELLNEIDAWGEWLTTQARIPYP
jgi:MoxR-like ATPase